MQDRLKIISPEKFLVGLSLLLMGLSGIFTDGIASLYTLIASAGVALVILSIASGKQLLGVWARRIDIVIHMFFGALMLLIGITLYYGYHSWPVSLVLSGVGCLGIARGVYKILHLKTND